ncbi:hypothetical protein D9758_004270 [Tetrapyrgos nigripes]|uniref:F-box domain-containing protein n=1 Tax=Tetrapyrgos nigripes TaxID=182062 RepID=A0A8H5GUI5_9AGAR|nr:hypothetical protein D9758_004270 [Tetrapyrgos nigripes]
MSSSSTSTDFFLSSNSASPVRPQVTRRRGTFQSLNKSLGRLSLHKINLKFFGLQIPRRRRVFSSSIPSVNGSPAMETESDDVVTLPYDIILCIADLLYQSDLLSLCLTSKVFHELLLPLLYHTIILRSSASCVSFLTQLVEADSSRSAQLCGHIREMAVRPNYYLAWPEPERPDDNGTAAGKGKRRKGVDEAWVADQIIELAPKMRGLDTFDWDGCEMPRDELWVALQTNCPDLRTVYSNVGYRQLNPHSALFTFSDLTAFSLTVRHGLSASSPLNPNAMFPDFTPLELLPTTLWDMLLRRCPDLEELTLCSFSSSVRNFDLQPLFQSRDPINSESSSVVPKLSALTLGTFGYTEDFTLTAPMTLSSSNNPSPSTRSLCFGSFLLAHTELRYLRLSWNFRRWLSPASVPIFYPSPTVGIEPILPQLTTFSGIYQHLEHLPNSTLANIQVLDLTCEPICEDRVDALCGVLSLLESLRELDIWVHIDFSQTASVPNYRSTRGFRNGVGPLRRLSGSIMVGHGGLGLGPDVEPGPELVPLYEHVMRKILGSCTGVEDLHWMSTTPLGPQPLASLSRCLGLLKSLKSFSLTKGHSYRDDLSFGLYGGHRMMTLQAGNMMLRSALTVINACASHNIAIEQVNIRWAREHCPNHLKQEGIYDVVRDASEERKIIGIDVYERGITMPGAVFKRRYRYGVSSSRRSRIDANETKTGAKRRQMSGKGTGKEEGKGKGKEKEQEQDIDILVKESNAQDGYTGEDHNDEDAKLIDSRFGSRRKGMSHHMRRLSRRFSFFSSTSMDSEDGTSDSLENSST